MNTYIIHLANGQLEEWNNSTIRFVGSWAVVMDENGEDVFAYPAQRISHIEKEGA